jgi:hypothetical protein
VVVRNEVPMMLVGSLPWTQIPHAPTLWKVTRFSSIRSSCFLEFDYGEPPIAMGHTVSSSTVPENCLEYSTRNHVIPAWDPTNGTTNENYRKGHSSNYGKPTSPLQTILRMVAETKKATANGAIRLGIDRREREWAWRDDEEGKDQSQYQGVN